MVSFLWKTALSAETAALNGLQKLNATLRTALRRIRQLQLRDVPILFRIAERVVKYAVCVRRRSLPDLVATFDASEARTRWTPKQLERAVILTRRIAHAIYGKDCCLPRSLVLFYFYTRCGHPAVFFVGIDRQQRTLRSHAWVQDSEDGEKVVSGPVSRYRVVFRYPN